MSTVAGDDILRYEHKRPGFRFRVFDKHIEVETPRLFGKPKIETILLRNVAGVKTSGMGNTSVTLMFNNGVERSWIIGSDAPKAADAISRSLVG